MGKQKLLQTISMALGGRAAESLTQDDICTGAVSDLKRATEVARSMVTRFGMSEKLGNVYLGSDQEIFVGMEFGQSREYSESTAAMIDEEVRAILDSAYDQSVSILRDHLDQLHGLAKMLIEKETVTREDFLQYIDPEKAAELMAAKAAMEAGEESAEEETKEEAKEENE